VLGISIDSSAKNQRFLASRKKHVLMITNHGVHQWQVIPGLPDTGGQNVFVNQFADELAQLGFRVTIANRGGYAHPVTGQRQRGLRYHDERQRIVYLEDGSNEFVRKEDMAEHGPQLADSLATILREEGTVVDLIVSHYWDGALVGTLYNRSLPERVTHIWVPHSLGAIKKSNVSPDQWPELRIDERIAMETNLIRELDGVAATSSRVKQALVDDYGYAGPDLFLPPCVNPERYYPRQVDDDNPIWGFLAQQAGVPMDKVRRSRIVTEISRTDPTKRKDKLIEAFALLRSRVSDALLVISIEMTKKPLADELIGRIAELELRGEVAVVGSIWEILPTLYAITDVYCTPSVMEGFGMSAQEAAATGVPVVASNLVPFVTEYLLGSPVNSVQVPGGKQAVEIGRGGLAVQADDVAGFAFALEMLLTDDDLRHKMGRDAYHITIPQFTWRSSAVTFLEALGMTPLDGMRA
jgi:glycosyltransferase involved in cell wall biosynthesis